MAPPSKRSLLALAALGAILYACLDLLDRDLPSLRSSFDVDDERYDARRLAAEPERAEAEAEAGEGAGAGGAGASDDVERPRRKRQLIHAISPYHDESATSYAPLNVEQWTSLQSAKAARDEFRAKIVEVEGDRGFDEVVMVCAIFNEDKEVLDEVLTRYCDEVKILPRSTATEHPDEGLKALPFVQDIVDAGESVAEGDDHWLMLTNSDICPTRSFYLWMEEKMRTRKFQAMIVNRMTVPADELNWPAIANEDSAEAKDAAVASVIEQSQDLMTAGKAKKHPGKDLFAVHSSLLKRLNFGDLFLGYTPWDANVRLALVLMSDPAPGLGNAGVFTQRSFPGGTFHLGNAVAWGGDMSEDRWAKYAAAYPTELEHVKWCPVSMGKPTGRHTLQLTIECGKWFRPQNRGGKMVPDMVEPGWEEWWSSRVKLLTDAEGGGERWSFRGGSPASRSSWFDQPPPSSQGKLSST